uniref:Uncharacterized protein n=1 Tax=Arundo donax TaxID=35708 RepID=A0A0A9ELL6_ARUDO
MFQIENHKGYSNTAFHHIRISEIKRLGYLYHHQSTSSGSINSNLEHLRKITTKQTNRTNGYFKLSMYTPKMLKHHKVDLYRLTDCL